MAERDLAPHNPTNLISLGGIIQRKQARFISNLNELGIPFGTIDQFISPDETHPPIHVPHCAIELSTAGASQIYHIQIAGRLEGNPDTDEVVSQTRQMFSEVMNRSMNYIHALADKLWMKRYEGESEDDPIQRVMKIGSDGTLITPVYRYGEQPVRPEDGAIVPTTTQPLPERQGPKILFTETRLEPRFLNQIFQPGETQLDLATYYSRAAALYDVDQSWATSAKHRDEMKDGLWLGHNPFAAAMLEQYFYYMMSHPDLLDTTFREEHRDELLTTFAALAPENQKKFLIEMKSITRDINSPTYVSKLSEKIQALPFLTRHLFSRLAAMNKTMASSDSPIEEAMMRYVYGISKPKPDENEWGISAKDEQMAKVGNFSALMEQFWNGRKEKHAPFYHMQEDEFSDIIFKALTTDTFYPMRLFPETARGATNIPTIKVTVWSPIASHIIFSSPKPHYWHMSLVVGNPLESEAETITTEERKEQHRAFVKSLSK